MRLPLTVQSTPCFGHVLMFLYIVLPVACFPLILAPDLIRFLGIVIGFLGIVEGWVVAAPLYYFRARRFNTRYFATLYCALLSVLFITVQTLIGLYIIRWKCESVADVLFPLLIVLPIQLFAAVGGTFIYTIFYIALHYYKTYMTHSLITDKMKQQGLSQAAINAFLHGVNELQRHSKMLISEQEISPAENLPEWESLVSACAPADAELLSASVLIKLNGGLGTSMGLQQAKSLLEIKPGLTFLDLIVRQVQTLREQSGSHVQLLLMNSFSTSADTMKHLSRYTEGGFADPAEVELLQNKVPKLEQKTLRPISWPAHPELEWCPPGHGDLYPALAGSGWLDKLLERGIKYAFISNSDNLGAQLDTRFLRWFAESGAPFVMEVTPRTEADKKGGHLAIRKSDGQPILREVAQCPAEDVPSFQDITRHRYFNTNNLWIRLDALRDFMAEHGGIVPLPVICNAKHVDPRDAATPPVYQLETAMGAALQCFPGARAVCVPRSRFFPVKTCSDLLLLRSDAVEITPEGEMSLAPECGGVAPVVSLDSAQYKLVDSLAELGVPSLKHVRKLTVHGKWRFAPGEPLSGEVEVGS